VEKVQGLTGFKRFKRFKRFTGCEEWKRSDGSGRAAPLMYNHASRVIIMHNR